MKTTTAKSYTNKGLTTGKTYYYKVRAYKINGSSKMYGKYSTVKSVYIETKVTISNINLASDGTLTYTLNNPTGNKTTYMYINLANEVVAGKTLTAMIFPETVSKPEEVSVNKAETFEVVSIKDVKSGKIFNELSNAQTFIIPAGESIEVTLKYVAGSTASIGLNKADDALAIYITYDDLLYVLMNIDGSTHSEKE